MRTNFSLSVSPLALAAALVLAQPALAQAQTAPDSAPQQDALERDYEERDTQAMTEPGQTAQTAAPPDTAPPGAAALDPEQLRGMAVHDSSGSRIGRVADVEMGLGGEPERLVISHGGFLGLGARQVAVDWQQAFVDEDRVVLDLTEQQVGEMPTHDPSAESPPVQTR